MVDLAFQNTEEARKWIGEIQHILDSIRWSLEPPYRAQRRQGFGDHDDLKSIILEVEGARISFSPAWDAVRSSLDIDAYVLALMSDLDRILHDPLFGKYARSIPFRARTQQGAKPTMRFLVSTTVKAAAESLRDYLSSALDARDNRPGGGEISHLRRIVPHQKVGPARFEIYHGRLRLQSSPARIARDDESGAIAAKEELRSAGKKILFELERSNCDRRLIESVQYLQEILADENANVVRLALANIGCEGMCVASEEELPNAVVSMLQTYTRGVELVVAQFPEWVRFLENAAVIQLSDGDVSDIRHAAAGVVEELRARVDIVDPEVPRVLAHINDLLRNPGSSSKRAAFAVLRSVENLVSKIFSYGADFIDKTVSKTVDHASAAISKVVVAGLLGVALASATSIAPVADKVAEMKWLRIASEIIQKQFDKIVRD